MGMARSMMKAMSMSGWLWGEVVATAVFILNRAPTQNVTDKTPHEVWHDTKPTVNFMRIFGCVVHVKQGSKRLGKLEDRITLLVFIGYEDGSKAWRIYDLITKRIHMLRDAIFKEDHAWD
jgi:hypothetical protein